MAKEKKKFNIYNLINPTKDGKGVKKEPDSPRNLKYFFKMYLRYFTRLTSVNLFIIFGNFPVFFGLFGLSGYLNTDGIAPASSMFAPFFGSQLISGTVSPVSAALYGVHGIPAHESIPTTATYVMYALAALTILTFGLVSVGTSYILRNFVRGEPVFIWQDFWYAIKRNVRQGLIFGVIDIGLLGLLAYDIFFFYMNTGAGFIQNMMFYFSIVIFVVYFVMRFYVYLMMITFDLSLFKLLKNAFIFSVLGFKRNFMAVLGIVFLVFINYSLLLIFIPLGAIFPFIILFGHGMFITAYAAYPKIDEIMIKPYHKDTKSAAIEPIFKDMG